MPPCVITHLGDLRRRGNNTERRARCGGRTGTRSHNNTLGSERRMNQSDKSSRVKNSLSLAEKLQLCGWVDPPVRDGAQQCLNHLIFPAAGFKNPLSVPVSDTGFYFPGTHRKGPTVGPHAAFWSCWWVKQTDPEYNKDPSSQALRITNCEGSREGRGPVQVQRVPPPGYRDL